MNKQLQKVIDGLEHHAGIADCGCWRVDGAEINPACPYYDDEDNGEPACGTKVLMDALDLLKEYDAALRMMVYQYCAIAQKYYRGENCENPDKEVFFHAFMSAGENAFKLLGIKNGEEVEDSFIWN